MTPEGIQHSVDGGLPAPGRLGTAADTATAALAFTAGALGKCAAWHTAELTGLDLASLLDPDQYTGAAPALTDRALRRH